LRAFSLDLVSLDIGIYAGRSVIRYDKLFINNRTITNVGVN